MKRIFTFTIGATLAAALVFAAPCTTVAVAEEATMLEVSADGTVYAERIGDIFGQVILVPRDVVHDSFIVGNASSDEVYLRIVLANVQASDPILAQELAITLAGPGWSSEPIALSAAAPCREIVTGVPLSGGESIDVAAGIALGDVTGTQAQNQVAGFQLQIVATSAPDHPGSTVCAALPPGATPPPSPAPTPSQPAVAPSPTGPPALGATGSVAPIGLLIAAVALVGAGATALAVRRRKQ